MIQTQVALEDPSPGSKYSFNAGGSAGSAPSPPASVPAARRSWPKFWQVRQAASVPVRTLVLNLLLHYGCENLLSADSATPSEAEHLHSLSDTASWLFVMRLVVPEGPRDLSGEGRT
jgi:hypothetical protein